MSDSLTDTFRILDAAANRTREGMRVVEDFVRMQLNDGHLSRLLKQHRHDFTAVMERLPATSLLASRDTLGDVGTTIGTTSEYQRTSPISVVTASYKRSQEALRTLEEYSKVIAPELASQFEQLRYRSYTLEKSVLRTATNRERLKDRQLYLLVTVDQCAVGFEQLVKAALDGGVKVIQLREKSLNDGELILRARQLREWTRAVECLLIINDRPDIAVLSDADGVHVGQDELSVHDVRRIVGPDRLVGVSTHSIEQAQQAVLHGADYLGVGPTFPSGTKSFAQFPGLQFIQEVAAEISLPWFAIGGIDETNLKQVRQAGASRIAVSGAICRSESPAAAVSRMISTLHAS